MEHGSEPHGYRTLLLHELERRCRFNAKYSLRAFARDLKMYPSRLCEIINGKKGLSRASAEAVVRRLNWTEQERRYFVTSVTAESARHPKVRARAQTQLSEYRKSERFDLILNEHFEVLADWVHFAILETLRLPSVKASATWFASRFGLSQSRAEGAINRLMRVGYLVKKNGRYHDNSSNLTTPEAPSKAIRDYHHQILKKADETLEACPLEEREYASLTMAVDSSRLPEAKEALRTLRRQFAVNIEQAGNPDRIYCLSLQFFPLDQKELQK